MEEALKPKYPENYEEYPDEQRKYLGLLSKYAMRGNKANALTSSHMPIKKETFVRENLFFLSTDEQVEFNDCRSNSHNQYNNSLALGSLTSAAFFTYFIVVTPVTRSLFKEAAKSFIAGLLSGYGYYRYSLFNYQADVHRFYVKILNKRAS
jgi:hypothetical protein